MVGNRALSHRRKVDGPAERAPSRLHVLALFHQRGECHHVGSDPAALRTAGATLRAAAGPCEARLMERDNDVPRICDSCAADRGGLEIPTPSGGFLGGFFRTVICAFCERERPVIALVRDWRWRDGPPIVSRMF